MNFREILVDFLWEYHILNKLQEILNNPEKSQRIILNIPRSIEYWNITDLIKFLQNRYLEYEVHLLSLNEVSKWETSDLKLILFYQDPIPYPFYSWIIQNINFSYISIEENHYLIRGELEHIFKSIFGNIENSELQKIHWDDFKGRIRLNNILKYLEKINSLYEKFGIRMGKYFLSSFTLNVIFSFLLDGKLPEVDYNFFRYSEQFLDINIDYNLNNLNQILDILKGFNRTFPHNKLLEAHIISKYLETYKIAKVEYFKNNQFSENVFTWNFQITYLWIYIKYQDLKHNYDWINEVLWAINYYNECKTTDVRFYGSIHPNEYNHFFWFKLFIFSSIFKENKDIKEYRYLNRIFSNLNRRFGLINRRRSQDNTFTESFLKLDDYILERIHTYIEKQSLNMDINETYCKIPVCAYKPDFKDKIFRISFKQIDYLDTFPELLLFQFPFFDDYDDLEDFFHEISEKNNISELLILLLIFRFYILVLEEFDNEGLAQVINLEEENLLDIYFTYKNLLSYRVWKLIINQNNILKEYWNNDYLKKFWFFDYHLLKNSYEYFQTLKKIAEIKEETNIFEFYNEEFTNFQDPSKFYTEFLLFDSNFFKLQVDSLREINNNNVILFVIDGMSYLLAMKVFNALTNELQQSHISSENINLSAVKIENLTETEFQLTNIWRAIYTHEKQIIVCHDSNVGNESLFNFCPELNLYIRRTNNCESLSIRYQRKIIEFYNPDKFFFVYISHQEKQNKQIFEEDTLLKKYKLIILEILKDILNISNQNKLEVFITSDHGSIFVKPDDFLQSNILNTFGLERRGKSRALFLDSPDISLKNKPIHFVLIENLTLRNKIPDYSLLPEIVLGGRARYEHTGISLEENIVPWIKITFNTNN